MILYSLSAAQRRVRKITLEFFCRKENNFEFVPDGAESWIFVGSPFSLKDLAEILYRWIKGVAVINDRHRSG